jgi:hypothetical protein
LDLASHIYGREECGELAPGLDVGIFTDPERTILPGLNNRIAVNVDPFSEFDRASSFMLIHNYVISYKYIAPYPKIRVIN